mmetsp:Transcript_2360/g.3308  ORF Transcript_2360/g.3308 Transcript_2360/m.3308 type:complete len:534 (-) Transcript_2360:606-2207(-)
MASDDDHDDDQKGGRSGKSRRELPAGAVATLKAWMLSPEHFTHPYPTPQDQVMLMQKTGIDKKQLKNWFTNARRRIWKPMLKKQLEQGKLTQTGGGGVAVPGVVQGLMAPTSAAGADHTQQDSQPHTMPGQYQQPPGVQQPGYEYAAHPGAPPQSQFQQAGYPPAPGVPLPPPAQQQPSQQQRQFAPGTGQVEPSNSIGSLTAAANITSSPMNKTDSHAVLMELFARDQDLVRQATEGATTKGGRPASGGSQSQTQGGQSQGQQVPQRTGSSKNMVSVPTLNSWPHFSSISSLNNLGSMTGVRSITSLSGADLSSQGNLTKMGSLAQMKSMESMSGKNDSYAFLEVFFGEKSTGGSSANLNINGKEPRGAKRDREEDNDIGLSLDEDQSPATKVAAVGPLGMRSDAASANDSCLQPAPLPANQEKDGTLKRAYDDALAARGLISVSRSCEKLTDLALPVTMQRTLSQEYLRQHQAQQQQQGRGQAQSQGQQPIPPPPQAAPPQPQQYGQFSGFGVPVSAPPAPPASAGPAQAG